LSEAYTKQTGVKVDLQIVDWNSIDQQVTTMIQNNQPPDVLNLNSFSSYAKDGLLHSAEDVLSPKTREDFLAAFARGGEFNGKLYGFPILSSARAFFYNKRLFAKASIAAPRRPGTSSSRPRRRSRRSAGHHRIRAAFGARGGAGRVGDLDVEQRRRLEVRRSVGDQQREEPPDLAVLADLANKHKVAQVNPGKTNRTDGAFQLFKDGKVGMVMGFSPLAKQLDAEGKVDYGVAEMPTNTGAAVTLGVETT